LPQIYSNVDGAYSNLIFDAQENLYGTGRGAYRYGDVFELSPNSGGSWTETVICSFTGGTDGIDPWGALVFDAQGNLYGTTNSGGGTACTGGCGTAFKLTPNSNGGWNESLLHTFNNKSGSGAPQHGYCSHGLG
jgi:hypothetical protein